MQPVKVEITVVQKPRTSIFDLIAVGTTPDYTQAYLNAVMQKYLDFKKGMRENQGIDRHHGDHRAAHPGGERICASAEDEMLEFQKQNNIGFIQEEGNSAAAYLVRLNQQYAAAQDRIRSPQPARSRPESRPHAKDRPILLQRRHSAGGRARRRNGFLRCRARRAII